MARADLLCDLIKCGSIGDNSGFRSAAEAICAEERAKQHVVLANKINELLLSTPSASHIKQPPQYISSARDTPCPNTLRQPPLSRVLRSCRSCRSCWEGRQWHP